MKFEPPLNIYWPNVGSEFGFFSHDVTDETLEPFFEVVINFNLFGVGDGEDLELIGELATPAESVVGEVDVVLVNFVFSFNEQENS